MAPEMPQPVVILGGGPAGMSAALWLHHMGLSPLLIDSAPALGGMQRFNSLENLWVLGQPGHSGPTLAEQQFAHLRQLAVPCHTEHKVLRIEGEAGQLVVHAGHPEQGVRAFPARAVVIATGTRTHLPTELAALPGFGELGNPRRAIGHECFILPRSLHGQQVLIIGGGDNAFENADHVVRRGGHATLAIRGTARAQSLFRDKVAAHCRQGLAEVLENATLQQLAMDGATQFAATLRVAGTPRTLEKRHRLHVLTGYLPNTDFLVTALAQNLAASLQFDARGYLRADPLGRTGCPGLYAVGDVANPHHPCVVSAISSGAAAARAIEHDFRSTR